jgi:hypothetical protein
MTPFEAARTAFVSYAAPMLGAKPAQVSLDPAREGVISNAGSMSIGDWLGFEAEANGRSVRGWARGKQAVGSQNAGQPGDLGAVVRASRVGEAGAMSAADLAARIVWMLGMGWELVATPSDYPSSPVPAFVTAPIATPSGVAIDLEFYLFRIDMPGGFRVPHRCAIHCDAAGCRFQLERVG